MKSSFKTFFRLAALLLISFTLYHCGPPGGSTTPAGATEFCGNGGLEDNNWTNWDGWTGTFSNPRQHHGIVNGRHTIVNAGGFDPSVGGSLLPVVPPGGGAHAVRLGNTTGGTQGEQLRYYFTVDNNNRIFRFRYAVVMNDPGHQAADQPRFGFRIVKTSGINKLITAQTFVANTSNPYFEVSPTNSAIIYRNWTCVTVDLSDYIGKHFFIEFTTKDCAQGAMDHFGLAYIDMVCGTAEASGANPVLAMKDVWCAGETVTGDGSASTGEINHYWSIEHVTSTGQSLGIYVGDWHVGLAGVFNLSAYFASKGYAFQCGQYYRIKLAMQNDCNGWTETTKIIRINCPASVNAGPDKTFCKGQSGVTIGTPAVAGYTYLWSPATGLSNATLAQPFANPASTTVYTLTVTAPGSGSCNTGIDQVTVNVESQPTVSSMSNLRPNLCGGVELIPGVTPPGNYTYQWSNGVNTATNLVNPTVSTTYTLTVTGACGSTTRSITVGPNPFQTLQIAIPNAFSPNGDGVNDVFRVLHPGMALGQPWAYGATFYDFKVYNRWGQLMIQRVGNASQGGFWNGEIAWDGRHNGSLQPRDVYIYTLDISSCNETRHLRGEVTLMY